MEIFENFVCTEEKFVPLPLLFISKESFVVPLHWILTEEERSYIISISVSKETCIDLEQSTMKQSESKLWHYSRKRKITSSNPHKVLIRQKNFEFLISIFTQDHKIAVTTAVADALKHGKIYEPIAREVYENSLKFYVKRDISLR